MAATERKKSTVSTTPQPPSDRRKERGNQGEAFAAQWLSEQGYLVVSRNWRPRDGAGRQLRGELDIVAWLPSPGEQSSMSQRQSGGVLCFVEVKTRSARDAAPQEAVTRAKQRQISRLAQAFVALELPHLLASGGLLQGVETAPDDILCRLDVIEVWLRADVPVRAMLRDNAFDFCEF